VESGVNDPMMRFFLVLDSQEEIIAMIPSAPRPGDYVTSPRVLLLLLAEMGEHGFIQSRCRWLRPSFARQPDCDLSSLILSWCSLRRGYCSVAVSNPLQWRSGSSVRSMSRGLYSRHRRRCFSKALLGPCPAISGRHDWHRAQIGMYVSSEAQRRTKRGAKAEVPQQ